MIRIARPAVVGLALAAVSLAAVASCGRQGDLERPGPIWGPKAKADFAAQKRDEAAKASNAAASNEVIAPQDPAIQNFTNPSPIHDQPIPGEPSPPMGGTAGQAGGAGAPAQ
ncbi:MAG: hypothetical protein ACREEW_07635 [Caulobacteraceae bacterium]